MPRDLPLSNGTLLVAFDLQYRIRDVCFPHVGESTARPNCGQPMTAAPSPLATRLAGPIV